MTSHAPRFHIIGTAGHVDHGKTLLINALTGVDTDRLSEEKARGISIELGFAPFRLRDGSMVGVVDVPGHERFIHNMLAGIGGIDLVLLVVDVNEGVMPQTREHLQILRLLEIPRGILVLSKCDLAEDDWIDIVEEEVRETLTGTFMAAAPCCRVSALHGTGLDELRATIETILAELPARDEDGPTRLPIDRHFTMSGFGTVVTGTLLSGTVRVGDSVEVLPPGETVRVRDIQVHGQRADCALAGQRVALNLAGLERADLHRGASVCTPAFFTQTARFDARLTLLAEAPKALKFRDPVHLHMGTAKVTAKVVLLDRDTLDPGESALVQLALDAPLVGHRLDRFIIRSYSPMTTIGGGRIIDPTPARHRRFRAEVIKALEELESGEGSFLLQKLTELSCVRLRELEQAAGLGRERISAHLQTLQQSGAAVCYGDQWLAAATARAWQRRLLERVDASHQDKPLLPGIPHATLKAALPARLTAKAFEQMLDALVAAGELQLRDERVARPGFTPRPSAHQQQALDRLEQVYARHGVQAKGRVDMLAEAKVADSEADDLLAFLFSNGRLIRLNDDSYLHSDAYQRCVAALRAHFADRESLTLAGFRDLIGSARKQTQAILEYFDSLKYTMRKGDERIAWQLKDET
ncbi:MAG: selenocysteine-specific translation elongation factor [Desulfuromonadales bacterium]|nr:selenocysteine-specific translation elongation factor [Desulfuromonadales bacterium]